MELLGGLVERSLVAVEERPDGVRYALLETVRQYAAEQLVAHGEAMTPEGAVEYALRFGDAASDAVPR